MRKHWVFGEDGLISVSEAVKFLMLPPPCHKKQTKTKALCQGNITFSMKQASLRMSKGHHSTGARGSVQRQCGIMRELKSRRR